jgi:uncharacterized protein (DUF1778 family)
MVDAKRVTIWLHFDEKDILMQAAAHYQMKWQTYFKRIALSHARQTLKLSNKRKLKKEERIYIMESEDENG